MFEKIMKHKLIILILIFSMSLIGCNYETKTSDNKEEKIDFHEEFIKAREKRRFMDELRMQNPGKAIPIISSMLRNEPQNIELLELRAIKRAEGKDYKGAISDLEKMEEISGKSSFLKGHYFEALGENKKALKYYLKNEYYYDAAKLFEKNNNFSEAIKYYTLDIEKNQNTDLLLKNKYKQRGILKIKTGKKNEGCQDLRTASEMISIFDEGDLSKEIFEAIRKYCN